MPDANLPIPYPDTTYHCDGPAQARVLDFLKRKDRKLKRVFAFALVIAGLAISCGVSDHNAVTLVFLAIFIVLVVIMIVILIAPPSGGACETCGGKLETVWRKADGGPPAEFRICRQCNLFTYMFRTSGR